MHPYARIDILYETVGIFLMNTSVEIGGATKLLVRFPSMEVSNLSEYFIFGVEDLCLFQIPGLLRSSACQAVLLLLDLMNLLVPVLSLESGVEVFLLPRLF